MLRAKQSSSFVAKQGGIVVRRLALAPVRISANKPVDALRADPAFDRLLGSVDGLGIFKDKSWADTSKTETLKR